MVWILSPASVVKPSGMKSYCFLQAKPKNKDSDKSQVSERESQQGRGSAPWEDKPVSVWRVCMIQPYRPDRLVPASNKQQATQSITPRVSFSCTRWGSTWRRRRRCLFSPVCPATARSRLRARSQMGSLLSSWGMNVCGRGSCLRIQTSLPQTPRFSSARVFPSIFNGRGQRYVSTEHFGYVALPSATDAVVKSGSR